MPEVTEIQLDTLQALCDRLHPISSNAAQLQGEIQDILDQWRKPTVEPTPVPWIDRAYEMPVNEYPDHPDFVSRAWYMWPSRTENPTGITIHHTMSHSPLALAEYIIRPYKQGGKGLPTTQYHFWVDASDGCPVWRLVPVDLCVWHDHTGAFQDTISVGLAGRLHEHVPPQEQLEAAGRLVRWLMAEYSIPFLDVLGHCDRYNKTVCPGWNVAAWREAFYKAVEEG